MTNEELRQKCQDFTPNERLIFFAHMQKLGAKFYMSWDNDSKAETIEVHNGHRSYWVRDATVREAYKRTLLGDGTKVCQTGIMRLGGVIKQAHT